MILKQVNATCRFESCYILHKHATSKDIISHVKLTELVTNTIANEFSPFVQQELEAFHHEGAQSL